MNSRPHTRGRHALPRRALGPLLPAVAMAWPAAGRAPDAAPPAAALGEWRAFKRRYLSPERRVVDTGNAGVSHSEGQSYGLLLAQHMDDRPAFDLLWEWTRANLRRRPDALLAWRWRPDAERPVADLNNATDGDLVAAWALARAGARWSDPALTAEAARIARDVLRLCTAEAQGRRVLLPGAQGFRQPEGVVVNPSCYAWGAIRALSRVAPDLLWSRLEADGLAVLREARFGRFGLSPDWLLLRAGGQAETWRERPARFSWDAVRVPLHLAWAALEPPVLERCLAFWRAEFRLRPPAWIDLITNVVPPYPGHAGIRAVIRAAAARTGAAPSPISSSAARRRRTWCSATSA